MALVFDIKVIPSSKKQQFLLDKSGKIKGFLKKPPEKGKANKELITLISKHTGIFKDKITILLGKTSRNKRIKIDANIELEELLGLLGIELQMSIK